MSNSLQKKSNHFVKVADTSQIEEGHNKIIFFRNKEIVIFNIQGESYALENLCPHRGGPLSEGEIYKGIVTCPWHGARFDLKTGTGIKGPHRHNVGSYRIKVEGTAIKIATNSIKF